MRAWILWNHRRNENDPVVSVGAGSLRWRRRSIGLLHLTTILGVLQVNASRAAPTHAGFVVRGTHTGW